VGRGRQGLSPDCVFDASLVPGTCLDGFVDLKALINEFLESRLQVVCSDRVFAPEGFERGRQSTT
jgi:hypothetical protein